MNAKNNLEIVAVLGFMDLKLKYRSSKLGFLWSFLKPLLQFVVYYLVFAVILNVGQGSDYPLTLFLGVLIWGFFTEGTSLGMNAYLGKKSIVTKINVNKILMPIASYVTPALNFLLNFIIFAVLYAFFSFDNLMSLTVGNIALFLLMFLDIGIIIVSCNTILANLNAVFRDVQNIWELVLQYGVFMTPILYPLPIPDEYIVPYFATNVLAYPIELIKCQFFDYNTKIFNEHVLLVHLCSLVVLMAVAAVIHRKMSDKVADYL